MTAPVVRDIVATRAEAEEQALPPLIILEPLLAFLDERGLGSGDADLHRIGDGESNITYSLRRGDERLVLRRGPRPPFARSTHDMIREARTQLALAGHGVPVPEIVAVCEDDAVLGVPFYLMRLLDGEIITTSIPGAFDRPEQREGIALAAVDLLAALHEVPLSAPEVAALGRPDGYLERQLALFTKLWHGGAARSLPLFDEVAERLQAQRPASPRPSVVHGDFRLGNIMFAPEPPARVLGLLDWEMSTLGDPLADLGYFLATYSERGEPGSVMELSPASAAAGFPTRETLARRFGDRTGLSLDAIPWYQALALWKSAVFCEEIYQRWRRGESGDGTEFARAQESGVPDLLHRARALL